MSMLCFLPWLRLKEPVSFDGHELAPFARRKPTPWLSEEVHGVAAAVLGHYLELKGHPVERGVIMVSRGHGPLDDLDRDEREELFTAVEVIAFAGLSAREFFSHEYWNRDHFTLAIQSFAGTPAEGAAVSSRRRDGVTTSYRTSEVLEFHLPIHVSLFGDVTIDVDLLAALQAARGHSGWGDLIEAMLGFNLANTDSEAVAERVEAVLLAGAFERLLGCNRGKADDVAVAFAKTIAPADDAEFGGWLAARNASGSSWANGSVKSLRELWMRDFYRLRNDFAHGRNSARGRPIWPVWEHLLLASYIFPRALKCILARSGDYVLSRRDKADIDAFEALAMNLPIGTIEVGSEHPWHRVLGEARIRATLTERLAEVRRPDPGT